MDDHKSWAVKDEAILDDLITLMRLSDDEKSVLAALKDKAEAEAPHMIEEFYERLLAHEMTAEYLEGMVEHLRKTLQDWFVQLFSGKYDEAYAKSRQIIGQVHVRIGLPVRYPLAMMDVMLQHGEQVVSQSDNVEAAKAAFRKLLALDIAIFNQAYESEQLRHLAETIGNERLARRLLTQEAH